MNELNYQETKKISNSEFENRNSLVMRDTSFKNFDLSGEDIDGEEFINCDFELQIFANTRFSNCTFINCSFYQTSFSECFLDACDFIDCNLEGSDIKEVIERMKSGGSIPLVAFDRC